VMQRLAGAFSRDEQLARPPFEGLPAKLHLH
jgi:hypothetical protein